MTDAQNCFIELIKNVVLDTALPEDFKVCDLLELYKLSKKQDMAHIVAYGLKKNNLIDLDSDLWIKCYKKQYSLAQFRVTNLQYEYENVCKVLEEAEIDYIPLKGAVIRPLYPEPWMRVSCDIDILVQKEDLRKAEQILADTLKYEVETDGYLHGHDDHIKTPNGFIIELHFTLAERITPATPYLNNVWNRVKISEGTKHQYKMDDEMFYFYHITHLAKHFRDGGCGVKSILDTYFINTKLKLDSTNCSDLIEKSNLLKFTTVIEHIVQDWFSGNFIYENEYMINYIFTGGVYGSTNVIAAKQTKNEGKRLKYYIQRAFPPYDFMCERYCSLRGKPLLLPYYWLKRIVTAFGKKDGKRTKHEIKTAWLEKEKSKEIKKMFDELGL